MILEANGGADIHQGVSLEQFQDGYGESWGFLALYILGLVTAAYGGTAFGSWR